MQLIHRQPLAASAPSSTYLLSRPPWARLPDKLQVRYLRWRYIRPPKAIAAGLITMAHKAAHAKDGAPLDFTASVLSRAKSRSAKCLPSRSVILLLQIADLEIKLNLLGEAGSTLKQARAKLDSIWLAPWANRLEQKINERKKALDRAHHANTMGGESDEPEEAEI